MSLSPTGGGQGGFELHRLGKGLLGVALALIGVLAAAPVLANGSEPSGERLRGQSAVEPAYDDATGQLVFLQTPTHLPAPPASTHTNPRAVAPLYLVMYPSSSTVLLSHNLNCMGVPGNCPDHDGVVAGIATQVMPGVYGTVPAAVPGHDHLVGIAKTGGDFNVAWEVWEVLFTNSAAANQHITTLTDLNNALNSGNAITFDLGFNFHCSAVSAAAYYNGSPA